MTGGNGARTDGKEGRPDAELDVVVTVFAGRAYLIRCLEALLTGRATERLAVHVPLDGSIPEPAELAELFPSVNFVPLDGVRTPAELRAAGVAAGSARLVALTEDHCIPAPEWAERIIDEHEAPHAAIGGVLDKVEPAGSRDSGYSWALYLSDWGRYMPPVEEGSAEYLTDCNVSYKRAALEPLRELWDEEFHETTVNWALQGRSESLWLSPRLVVRQQRSLSLAEAVRDRYGFGRLFAATRVEATGLLQRLAYAAGSLLLPAVLTARVAATVWKKGKARGTFIRVLPALLVTTTVWALGELTGYLTGRPPLGLRPR